MGEAEAEARTWSMERGCWMGMSGWVGREERVHGPGKVGGGGGDSRGEIRTWGSIKMESEFEIRGDGRRARIRCYSAAWTRRRSISMAVECVPGFGHVHDLYISARSGSSAPQMRFLPAARHRFSRHTLLLSISGSAPIHIISPISPISDGPNLDSLFCCSRPVNSSQRSQLLFPS